MNILEQQNYDTTRKNIIKRPCYNTTIEYYNKRL